MLLKYEEFLKQKMKDNPDMEYWERKYEEFKNMLDEQHIPTSFEPEFYNSLRSIFNTGDSIETVLEYCYEELPIMPLKDLTFGDKSIMEVHLNSTIVVDYEQCEILVEGLPIRVNGYSLFKLTLGDI